MTIIVTGGAGFIGSNFIFHMLNKYPDYRIICLDCLTYAGNLSTLEPVMSNPNFRFVKESITDREAVYKLFEEEHPDMVVNLNHTLTVLSRTRKFSLQLIFLVHRFLWMPAESTVFRDTIRYLLMKYTAIFHLTDLTFSSQKRHQSIHQAHTAHQRLAQTYLFLLTTELMDFLLLFQDALITMDHTTSQRSLSLL